MTTVEVPQRPRVALTGQWITGPWVRFVARRVARFVVSLWLLITASWAIVHAIPGDPVRAALGISASQSVVNRERAALGLNQPLLTQYWHFLTNAVTGNFGTSLAFRLPVSQVIGARLPATLEIAGISFLAVVVFAIPLGVLAGAMTRDGSSPRLELVFSAVTGVIASIPQFLLAIGLVAIFSVGMHVFPVAGRGGVNSYVLPVIALASGPAMLLMRVVRVETIRVLHDDYMRTAAAKRLPVWRVYVRHAFPNLLTSTLTVGSMVLAGLVASTVLVETVFAWPGMGTSMVTSIIQKDYPLVQGYALVYGGAVLLINLVVDLLIAVIDPRATLTDA